MEEWSHEHAGNRVRVRIEKPIEISLLNSVPEPDIAWVTRRRYSDRHPTPEDIQLLIEVSASSQQFDRGEKLRLYAEANVAEYWIVDVAAQTIEVFTDPQVTRYLGSSTYKCGQTVSPRCHTDAILPVDRLFSETVQ